MVVGAGGSVRQKSFPGSANAMAAGSVASGGSSGLSGAQGGSKHSGFNLKDTFALMRLFMFLAMNVRFLNEC